MAGTTITGLPDASVPLSGEDRLVVVQGGVTKDAPVSAISLAVFFPVSSMMMYAGTTEPENWLFCQGQSLAAASYPELYSLIGTTYGSTGAGFFSLPDLRGRAPFGAGTSADTNPDTDAGTHVADTWVLGKSKNDRIHEHAHSQYRDIVNNTATSGAGRSTLSGTAPDTLAATGHIGGPIAFGGAGTPRIGNTTRVKGVGINFIIKVM